MKKSALLLLSAFVLFATAAYAVEAKDCRSGSASCSSNAEQTKTAAEKAAEVEAAKKKAAEKAKQDADC